MKYYKVNMPIERERFTETNSAKFKADLNFVCNEFGIIYDWQITFNHLEIDLYTTERWFKDKPKIFEYRENLFKKLGFKQSPRPSKTSNSLSVPLSEEQLKIVDEYFNDRNQYKSSLKNIVGVLKGNNPGGEAKNPKSAEMIISGVAYKNFVILLDDLVVANNESYFAYALNSKSISLSEFVELSPDLSSAFKYMQNPKSKIGFSTYLLNIKSYVKKYEADLNMVMKNIQQHRTIFGKKVDDKYHSYPFGFKDNKDFQKAHIYDVHLIRDEIMIRVRKKQDFKNLLEMVSDPENFIPLTESIHRQFDRYQLSYNEKGDIFCLTKQGKEFIERIDTKFKKIPNSFLSIKKIEYFKKRNSI